MGILSASFTILMQIISFFLIILANISSTILNKYGKVRQPCLVPEPSGNAFSPSSIIMILALSLSCLSFVIFEICSSYTQFVEDFYHEEMLNAADKTGIKLNPSLSSFKNILKMLTLRPEPL